MNPEPAPTAAETPTKRPYPLKQRMWQTELTDEVLAIIKKNIHQFGLSDSEAGVMAGVSTSTLSRWKEEWEEFADNLKLARACFFADRMQFILEQRKPNGELDWRAQAWAYREGKVDEDGERLHRGNGRPPAAVRKALAKQEEARQQEEKAKKPKWPKDPCDYEWPGGDEEIIAAINNEHPDPDDTRYLPDGGLIMTPRVLEMLQRERRKYLLGLMAKRDAEQAAAAAAAAEGASGAENVQNVPTPPPAPAEDPAFWERWQQPPAQS